MQGWEATGLAPSTLDALRGGLNLLPLGLSCAQILPLASAHCIPVLLQCSPIPSGTTAPSVVMSHPQVTFLAVGETFGPNQGCAVYAGPKQRELSGSRLDGDVRKHSPIQSRTSCLAIRRVGEKAVSRRVRPKVRSVSGKHKQRLCVCQKVVTRTE